MFDEETFDNIPENFCLMSWNIFKIDHKKTDLFNNYIQATHDEHNIDIFCLQESKYSDATTFPISKFHINFASNIALKNHDYGVTTASHIPTKKNIRVLTTHKESVINTHKASLISHFSFGKQTLIIVNIHAINFKSNKVYEYEFERIKEFLNLKNNKNPIIIAGDFNTWNRTRIKLIKDFCREFNFKVAFLDGKELIKSFQNNPLDFVLYRDLKLEKALALDCNKISDHNPIITYFSKD